MSTTPFDDAVKCVPVKTVVSHCRANQIFPRPKLITSRRDKDALLRSLDEEDLLNVVLLRRPDTKFRLVAVVNVRMKVFPIEGQGFIGAAEVRLPDYLMKSQSVQTLLKDQNGRPYANSDCLFRAFLVHINDNKLPTKPRTELGKLKEQYASTWNLHASFNGHIPERDLIKFESTFSVRVVLYSSCAGKDGRIIGKLYRPSPFKSVPKNGTMYCDYTNNHVSLITRIKTYCHSYVCPKCNEFASVKPHVVNRHAAKHCDGAFRKKVRDPPLVRFQSSRTLFDELTTYGIKVDEEQRYSKEVSAWDLESVSRPVSTDMNTSCWEFVSQQVVCAASVKSTLPPFDEPICFLSETLDPESLVSELVDYFLQISEASEELEKIRLQSVFDQLESKIEQSQREEENNLDNETVSQFWRGTRKQLERLQDRLLERTRQHTFYGFNSGSLLKHCYAAHTGVMCLLQCTYAFCLSTDVEFLSSARFDTKLIMSELVPLLHRKGIRITNVIVQAGNFLSLDTDRFRLRDYSRFCSPGVSLDQVRYFSLSHLLPSLHAADKCFVSVLVVIRFCGCEIEIPVSMVHRTTPSARDRVSRQGRLHQRLQPDGTAHGALRGTEDAVQNLLLTDERLHEAVFMLRCGQVR